MLPGGRRAEKRGLLVSETKRSLIMPLTVFSTAFHLTRLQDALVTGSGASARRSPTRVCVMPDRGEVALPACPGTRALTAGTTYRASAYTPKWQSSWTVEVVLI